MKVDEDELLKDDEVQAEWNLAVQKAMRTQYPGLLEGAEEALAKRARREAAKSDPTSEDFSEAADPPAPPPVDPVAQLAAVERARALDLMALGLGVRPEAVQDWTARMTKPRGPSAVDPTSDEESDAEASIRIKAEAPHLFTASGGATPAGPRDPW